MPTLHQTAGRLGAHQWFEQTVWRVLGAWAGQMAADLPAAAVLVDVHAQHAAWRAQQWWERLPVLATVERSSLISPASPSVAAMVHHLDAPDFPTSTVARLAASYRVLLPRLWSAYRHEAVLLSEVADGAARRTLTQVSADVATDWQAGESFLQSLLLDGADIDRAASVVAGLERSAAGDPPGEATE